MAACFVFVFLSLFIFSFQMEIDLKPCQCLIPIISTLTPLHETQVQELNVLQCQWHGACQRSPVTVSRGVLMMAEGRQSLPQLGDMSREGLLLLLPTQHCEGMISWSCWEFISHTNCHRKHFVKISKSK